MFFYIVLHHRHSTVSVYKKNNDCVKTSLKAMAGVLKIQKEVKSMQKIIKRVQPSKS